MIQSFRLRLALLSALLAGLALAAFGFSAWWMVRNLKIDRIDSEVRTQAERMVNRPRDNEGWSRAESRLTTALGLRDSRDLLLLVLDESGEILYRSTHWPTGLDSTRLQWPKQGLAQAPASGEGGFGLISGAIAAEQNAAPPWLLAQAGRGPGGGPGMGPGPGGRFPPGDRPPLEDRPPPGGDTFGRLPPRQDSEPGNSTLPPREFRRPQDRLVLPNERPRVRPAEDLPLRPAIPATIVEPAAPESAVPVPHPAPEATVEKPVSPAPVFQRPELPLPPPASSTTSQTIDGHLWRIGLASTERLQVAVAVDARSIDADMNGIRNAFLVAMPLALLLIGVGSWLFAGRALRPLEKLTVATRQVTAEGLNQRISSKGEDHEFVELIEVFNRMLERLERSFKQAHRFSADAAHELKTPLAILQGQLERAINAAEDASPMQAELSSILDEVRRLSTISRKLLLLSQADAGGLKIHRETFDLSKALNGLVEDTSMLAPHLKVTADIHPGVKVEVDGSLLRQVLHNLISNAIKYNVENGWIKISTALWAQRIEVKVSNSSPGIPAADRSKIFERFYRADPAHSRQVEGVGLGLSVSREIARSHGGDLVLKASSDSDVEFSLLLPVTSVKAAQ